MLESKRLRCQEEQYADFGKRGYRRHQQSLHGTRHAKSGNTRRIHRLQPDRYFRIRKISDSDNIARHYSLSAHQRLRQIGRFANGNPDTVHRQGRRDPASGLDKRRRIYGIRPCGPTRNPLSICQSRLCRRFDTARDKRYLKLPDAPSKHQGGYPFS